MVTSKAARGLELSVESQRRRQISKAVMECITEDGLERTTMRNVARRAGVSTGTLAYYFKSKKELVDAALLDASREYMERFSQEDKPAGPGALDEFIDRFLAPDNTNAGFVLQMIEVGLHNSELRGTHQEMVDAGREMIESCLRSGMEVGQYRPDLDPALTAALLHGVLIWWGSELLWNATSQELAMDASRLMLRLLEVPARDEAPAVALHSESSASTVEQVRAVLQADPSLTGSKARMLASAFENMYGAATDPEA